MGHRPGGQIGQLLPIPQNDKAAVLGQQMQPGLELRVGSFNGLVPCLEMKGRGTPADQRQTATTAVDDRVAELLAHQPSALKVMVFANQTVPLGFLFSETRTT